MAIDFPANPTDGQSFTFNGGSWTYDSSVPGWVSSPSVVGSLPAGTILAWAASAAPQGWLVCDGSAVSRTEYATLFNAIGTTYGAGNGTTTFNLPNLKGRVPVGRDSSDTAFDTLGETGGAKTHTLTVAELPSHDHTQYGISGPSGTGSGNLALQSDGNLVWYRGNGTLWAAGGGSGGSTPGINVNGSATRQTSATGSSSAHNNLQPYQVVTYIIKWTMASSADNEGALTERLNALEATANAILPTGSIVATALSEAPAGWLLCDGSAVSRSTYSSLFGVIGTTYGSGDGSTTFNLPDLRGRVLVGRDASQTEFNSLGETGGAKTHTLSIAEMPSHTHIQNAHNHAPPVAVTYGGNAANFRSLFATNSGFWSMGDWNNAVTSTTATNQNTGGGEAHNNLQPYTVTNYIIKHSTSESPTDSELAGRVGSLETRATVLEARKLSGLIPIVPPSVTVAGGTATAAADGTITFTSATSVSLNNVFTSEYQNYMLKFSLSATGTFEVRMRMRTNGSDRTSTGYSVAGTRILDNNVGSNMASAGLNGSPFVETLNNGINYHTSTIQMFDPFVASKPVNWSYHSTGVTSNSWGNYTGSGRWSTAESNDGFTFYPTGTGNITGTVQVFAYH